MTNQTTANNLFNQLRDGLLAAQDAIEKIIATRAWEALGYDTFQAAWEDRLADVKLTGSMRATVVYALFDEGASDTDVALTVAGVGSAKARTYRQAHNAGISPEKADQHTSKMVPVQPHQRRLPTKKNAVTLTGFTDTELKAWNDLAHSLDTDRNTLLRDALREGMKAWEQIDDDAA